MARLRAAECREFIKAVVEKAEEMGVAIAVAVVGREGHLLAAERMDEAGFITPETAIAKAFTVAAFRSMSPRFPDGLVIQQWFKERNPQLLIGGEREGAQQRAVRESRHQNAALEEDEFLSSRTLPIPLAPAKAGTQCWIYACAGMSGVCATQFNLIPLWEFVGVHS
jgi:Haem degrading protein HbpS-like